MNARLLWTFILTLALNAGVAYPATQAEQSMQALSERLQHSLQEFDEAADVEPVTSLADEVFAFQSRQEPPSRVRIFKARSLVQSVAALEGKFDPKFDPNDLPLRNVPVPGRTFPAGVDPSAIKDEAQRKEYEAAIEANRAKAAAYQRQYRLVRSRDRVLGLVEALASDRTVNPSESRAELTSLLNQYKVSSSSRSRILQALPPVG